MKDVYIIHGCPSSLEETLSSVLRTYDKHWIPWTKKKLIAQGIRTKTPLMPKPWSPNYEAFKNKFEKYHISERTTLVGHSCGCAFLVRWLGESKQKIDNLILVAPWKIAKEGDVLKREFYEYHIDESIRLRVSRVVIFTADNEKEDGKRSAQIFHRALGGKIIELRGRGHYTLNDIGTQKFPE